MSTGYCERCGRPLRIKVVRWHTFDGKTGKKKGFYQNYYYCWFGRLFGRGGDYEVQHDYFTDGTHKEEL